MNCNIETYPPFDKAVKKMINEQYERAKQLLTEHKEGHAQLAQMLVEREVIFAEDVEKIFGKRPWTSRTEELLSLNENTGEADEDTPAITSQPESSEDEKTALDDIQSETPESQNNPQDNQGEQSAPNHEKESQENDNTKA